jgi:transposase InsO family protein
LYPLAPWCKLQASSILVLGVVSMEEAELVADRAHLRKLLRAHPTWPYQEYADQIGRSYDWVKKWAKRLLAAPPDNEAVLWSRSSARKHLALPLHPAVIEQILDIRDHPPEHLKRTPGPRAILYYLHRNQALLEAGLRLPRSTRTIWEILHAHGRIAEQKRREHVPVERPEPLSSWQLDLKDASTVPSDPEGKKQHVVETFDILDTGTSLALAVAPDENYTAETVFTPVVDTLRQYGLPDVVGFDRDPRFVGSASGRDFPTPFVRFWQCLGVEVYICPPRRPDKNAFVERFHRSLGSECLDTHRPTDVGQVREVTSAYHQHYNWERPNQAITCGNRPPRVAFPTLPVRPEVPAFVNPDGWLRAVQGERYARKVKSDGRVVIGERYYYVQKALAGEHVVLEVDADTGELVVWHREVPIKRLELKGLRNMPLTFDAFVDQLRQEARQAWRQTQMALHARRQAS